MNWVSTLAAIGILGAVGYLILMLVSEIGMENAMAATPALAPTVKASDVTGVEHDDCIIHGTPTFLVPDRLRAVCAATTFEDDFVHPVERERESRARAVDRTALIGAGEPAALDDGWPGPAATEATPGPVLLLVAVPDRHIGSLAASRYQ